MNEPAAVDGGQLAENVYAVYRYERSAPGEVRWVQVRELTAVEWDAATQALQTIYRFTRGLDAFPTFAWGDLRSARDELLRQVFEEGSANEWMMPLIEYRLLNYSTALKLYHEYITAQANRSSDEDSKSHIEAKFSELYDRSFGYRLVYSMRNAFQHGARGMTSLRATVRLADGSDSEREAEVHAYLDKDSFSSGRANAAVRRQVREMNEDIDLFVLSEEAFAEIQILHADLAPLLYPGAPAAAQLLIRYIKELGGERPHFHKYSHGLPMRPLVTRALDRGGFEYVAQQAGTQADFEGEPPTHAMAALPVYPRPTGGQPSMEGL